MSAFNCPSCNAHNASSSRFCTACGSSLMVAQKKSSPYQSPTSHSDAPALVAEFAFAGFWKRLLAYIFDALIFTTAFGLIIYLLGNSSGSSSMTDFGKIAGFYFLYYPAWWLYFSMMESSSLEGTLGKKIMGIKVSDLNGQPLTFGKATARHFSAFITQLTFSIGYIMSGFTARKQALHDIIAGTLVVNKRYGTNQIQVASANPGTGMSAGGIVGIILLVLIIPVGGILAAIAIPAYQDYTIRAKIVQSITETQFIKKSITDHAAKTGYWPNTLEKTGLTAEQLNTKNYRIELAGEGAYQVIFISPNAIANSRLNFVPDLTSNGGYQWQCSSNDLKTSYLPKMCRHKN